MNSLVRGMSMLRAVPRAMASGSYPNAVRACASKAAPGTAAAGDDNHFNSTLTVDDILSGRGEKIYTAKKHQLVFDAVKTMVDRNIGSLIVTGEDQIAEGILTERDYLDKVIVLGRSSKTTYVHEIMSRKDLISVSRDSTLTECMELMTENRVRHIPVLDGKRCVGLVSIGDVVHALTESYKRHASHMESFIAGSY